VIRPMLELPHELTEEHFAVLRSYMARRWGVPTRWHRCRRGREWLKYKGADRRPRALPEAREGKS